jgi:hypothetical protein
VSPAASAAAVDHRQPKVEGHESALAEIRRLARLVEDLATDLVETD